MAASWHHLRATPEEEAAMDARLAAWPERDSCTDVVRFMEVALGREPGSIKVSESRVVIRPNVIRWQALRGPERVCLWVEGFDVEVEAPTLAEAQWDAVHAVIANANTRLATGDFYAEPLMSREDDLAYAEMRLRENTMLVLDAPDTQTVWNLLFDRETALVPDHVPDDLV